MRRLCAAAVVAIAFVAAASALARAAGETYRIDPGASHITIAVGKAGAFSFVAGHTHEVSGTIESGTAEIDLDDPGRSRVHLVIAAAALRVSGKNEPPADGPQVQETMDSAKVLDVMRYPRITFEGTDARITRRDGASLDATVAGRLTIRGVTRPVTAPVHVELSGRALTTRGRLTIRQTDFGIKPVSVGGVVAVKDTLEIAFVVAARR